MLDQGKNVPLYLQIKDMIRSKIDSGELKPGDQIPTETEMIETYQVSRVTIKNAYKLLVEEGIVHRIPGKGTFVSSKEQPVDYPQELRKIGFLSPPILDSFSAALFRGVEEGCREHGFMLMIRQVSLQSEERSAIREMVQTGAEGLILFPVDGEAYSEEILKLKSSGFPFVLVDRYLPGIKTNAVYSDNYQGGILGTEYLIEKGHTLIGVLSGTKSVTASSEDRFRGYLDTIKKHNLIIPPSYWLTRIDEMTYQQEDISKSFISDWLRTHPEMTAVFVFNPALAVQVFQAAALLGKQIPGDLAILTYDNPDIRDVHTGYFFTRIEQNIEGIGFQATQLLSKVLMEPSTLEQEVLPVTIQEGRTV